MPPSRASAYRFGMVWEGQSGYVTKGKGAPVYRITKALKKGKALTPQGFSSANPWYLGRCSNTLAMSGYHNGGGRLRARSALDAALLDFS